MLLSRRQFFVLLSLAGLILLYFLARNILFRSVAEWKISGIEKRYGLTVHYSKAEFIGIKTLRLQNLTLVAIPSDTLLKVDTLLVNPRLLPLLMAKKQFSSIMIRGMNMRMNSALVELWFNRRKKNPLVVSQGITASGYAAALHSLESELFITIPGKVEISNSSLTYRRDALFSTIECRYFLYRRNRFTGDFVMRDNLSRQPFMINGELNKGRHSMMVQVYQARNAQVRLPYVGPRWNARLGFDSLAFSLSFNKASSGRTLVDGQALIRHLMISHKKISPEPVTIDQGNFGFHILASQNFIELDSSTGVGMNGFSFHPFIHYDGNPSRKLTVSIIRKEFNAQALFDALPGGLFMSFKGIQTSGNMVFHLNISLDFDNPDSVKFDSGLESKAFAIKRFGWTDFRVINESFTQEIYDEDQQIANFLVGPENPNFVALDDISPYLKYAVLTAEDGGFFYHKGFSQDAFRESIIANLKEKRFARGGSTLTMQLVKNVFLNHQKTVSRKLEEALIVWMIENMHLVSKERIFEVYLNIIEWGPAIYGVRPASRYYFNKEPKNLNLQESIFLSAIIPRPKGFRYVFEKNGELKPFMGDYYRIVSNFMVHRNQIPPEDTSHINIHLTLTGDARFLLATPDTARIDTLVLMPLKELLPVDTLPAVR